MALAAIPEAITPTPEMRAAADKLLQAANEGAKSLKALFFWYVGALAYAIISVAGVTDLQLLTQAPLKLPILAVDIPFVEYFAFLPVVVVLIHMELLVQFALLSNKLQKLDHTIDRWEDTSRSDIRRRLENFMLSHLLVGEHRSVIRCFLFLLIYGALIVLPVFTLLLIQAQFLANHSAPMMWWHRILITIDAGMLLYFWPNLFRSDDLGAWDWIRLMVFRVGPRVIVAFLGLTVIYLLLALLDWRLIPILLVLGFALLTSIIAILSQPTLSDRLESFGPYITVVAFVFVGMAMVGGVLYVGRHVLGSYLANPEISGLSLALLFLSAAIAAGLMGAAIANEPDPRGPTSHFGQLGRMVSAWHRRCRRDDAPGMTAFALLCLIGTMISWLLLQVPDENEAKVSLNTLCPQVFGPEPPTMLSMALSPVARQPAIVRREDCEDDWIFSVSATYTENNEIPIRALVLGSLGKRRHILLNDQILVPQAVSQELRQDIRQNDIAAIAEIEPIDLRSRNLLGADFSDTLLPRARLSDAVLDGAGFFGANLVHADLSNSYLQRADFDGADLTGATFEDANLNAADLISANLRRASLERASLIGAKLSSTQMDGANLSGADLTGASVSASLRGASLRGTILVGAVLGNNTDFSGAVLELVDVADVDLRPAKFDFAVLIDPRIGDIKSHSMSQAMLDGVPRIDTVRRALSAREDMLAAFDMATEDALGTRLTYGAPCLMVSTEPRLSGFCKLNGLLGGYIHPTGNLSDLTTDLGLPERQFWEGFAVLAVKELCAISKGIDPEPQQILPGFRAIARYLPEELRLMGLDADSQAARAFVENRWRKIRGVVADRLGAACRRNWDQERVESVRRKAETAEVPDAVLLGLLDAWLERLK